MRKPLLIVLIGLPGLGKSTWRENYLRHHDFNGVIASTDDIIDEWAEQQNTTYNAIYHASMKEATELWEKMIHLAFTKRLDLMVDRTNMNKKSRDRFMRRARNAGYDCRAIAFQAPVNQDDMEEWKRRLDNRPGKTIPYNVLLDMQKKYEQPTPQEGFGMIGIIDTFTFPTTLQVLHDSVSEM